MSNDNNITKLLCKRVRDDDDGSVCDSEGSDISTCASTLLRPTPKKQKVVSNNI